MKNLKTIILIIVVLVLLLATIFLFQSKFKSGWCVKDNRNGYTWQINNFSFGKYRLMGWQDGAWGNAVEMNKSILERKDVDGIRIYNRTTCPEYIPR